MPKISMFKLFLAAISHKQFIKIYKIIFIKRNDIFYYWHIKNRNRGFVTT